MEKKMEEGMKQAEEAEKAIEDPKVAKKLEAENNEYGEKITATA